MTSPPDGLPPVGPIAISKEQVDAALKQIGSLDAKAADEALDRLQEIVIDNGKSAALLSKAMKFLIDVAKVMT